jgi:glutamyl-Q tRNA(Asp) synthetase
VTPAPYRGRFAPSPTGPLHFGSLVAAIGSYLRARAAGGQWLVRMEDIDPPREMPGAADAILASLEAFGLDWYGPVMFQSSRLGAYETALEHLLSGARAYPCSCSRREIATAAGSRTGGGTGHIYPGTCRSGVLRPGARTAIRLLASAASIEFVDRIQGRFGQRLDREVGDFVLRRRDGLAAYQLAVVVDDAEQGITEVVRGCDLLDNTPRQIYLQQVLGLPTPDYAHLPIAVNERGEKLSKQTGAVPLDPKLSRQTVFAALRFLGMQPDSEMRHAPAPEQLAWACTAWDPSRLSGVRRRAISPRNALAAAQ